MDELEISGRRFLSTRRAAKDHKYTSDYVGQLIRSGKVKGQKVGRSWYVDEQSLNAYLSGETPAEPPVKQVEVVKEETPVNVVEPVVEVAAEEPEQTVEPAEKTKEEKQVEIKAEPDPEQEVFEPVVVTKKNEEHRVPIRTTVMHTEEKPMGGLRYVADDEPVLPEVKSKSAVTSIPIKPVRREEKVEYTRAPSRKRNTTFAIISLAVIGTVTLSITAVVSSMLNSKIVIEDGQTANVGYTFR